MEFPPTQWSLLARATLHGDAAGRSALAEFHRRYREPVAAFIRRRGTPPDDVEDLAQEFFVHLMQQATLRRADASRGRFRSFLLGTLVRFLTQERTRRAAVKRGGASVAVSLESVEGTELEPTVPAADQQAYDHDWAVELLRQALATVEEEFAKRGRVADFAILRAYLPGTPSAPPAYESAAERLGIGLGAVKTEVHRLRERVRETLRRQVAATVAAPEEIDGELAYLGRVLQARMP